MVPSLDLALPRAASAATPARLSSLRPFDIDRPTGRSSIERQCEFVEDGSRIRFGDDLLIEGRYPRFEFTRRSRDVEVRMSICATDKVSYFIDLRGGRSMAMPSSFTLSARDDHASPVLDIHGRPNDDWVYGLGWCQWGALGHRTSARL